MALGFAEHDALASYDAAARPFLLRQPDVNNVLLGLLEDLRRGASYPGRRLFTVSDGADVEGAAHLTPPHPLALSTMPPEAAAALAAELASQAVEVPGVFGPADAAAAFDAAWCARTGARVQSRVAQLFYRLDAVRFPEGMRGVLRLATESDLPLLREWTYGFCQDCNLPLSRAEAAALALAAVGARERRVLLVDGAPVAVVGTPGRAEGGARIGWVYTPPALRGRGYATEAVARASAHLLETGARFCVLYTDLANDTSNRIYPRVGFRHAADALAITYA